MLITHRGLQYDTSRRTQVNELAQVLRIPVCIARLYAEHAPPSEIDRALWEAILRHVPGSLTHDQISGAR